MSSYVISKRAYIRCAGFIAGLANFYNHSPRELWVYDYAHHRNSTAEDYREAFTRLYRLNAESVQIQYDDPIAKTDDNAYNADFVSYFKRGESAAMHGPAQVMGWVKKINSFAHSALYQTEDEERAKEMQLYFWRVLSAMIDRCTLEDETEGFWGHFNETEDPVPRNPDTAPAPDTAPYEMSPEQFAAMFTA